MTEIASPAEMNPAQAAVVARGLLTSGFNCVLQMPTGSGKTWLGEQAIEATLKAGGRAIYLTPLRALANELLMRWRTRFSDVEVGVFTGEYGQRKAYPVPFERARVLIMTPERLDACTRHWRTHWSWLPEVNLLVVDELHLLGERRRGPRLEGALMRVRRLNPFVQVLGLSATLGNREELAEWLTGVHFGSDWRQTPLEWRVARYQRATDKPRILIAEVSQCVAAGGQSLVFVQSRRRAEALGKELQENGIVAGHHHAGLESAERAELESAFRRGALRALVSTGTLEMGLNLPARQVVLYDLQAFDGTDFVPLTVNTVWQRAGRAGRRGLDNHGEVVLLAPSWDRTVDRYARGQFERVLSGMGDTRALAEQVLAEVASGLARTRAQLDRNLSQSLAAHQGRLPSIAKAVEEMIEARMLTEMAGVEGRAPTLKPTRLGRIAVRQMLSPSTVAALARVFERDDVDSLSLFDLLLLCAQTDDCEPLIPVDFEELDELGAKLSAEHSWLLSAGESGRDLLAARGRRLLAVLKTALVARAWTREGDAVAVAEHFGCYPFEVRRLSESLGRILTAAVAVASPPEADAAAVDEVQSVATVLDETPSLLERLTALVAMVAHGLDEDTVTLTFVEGIGGTLARRLRDAGIGDIEDLALAELEEFKAIRGISPKRASQWIEAASAALTTRSALSLRDVGTKANTTKDSWTAGIDPYRLSRAQELRVVSEENGFTVSGGLEPHRVAATTGVLNCDCADFAKGKLCKHTLAVRLSRRDPELLPLVARLAARESTNELDLFQHWFSGGKR